MPAVRCEKLSKAYGRTQAVRELDLTVPAGGFAVIYGPSGSGKTTLLRLISGLETPDAGSIHLDDHVVSSSDLCVAPAARGLRPLLERPALARPLGARGARCGRLLHRARIRAGGGRSGAGPRGDRALLRPRSRARLDRARFVHGPRDARAAAGRNRRAAAARAGSGVRSGPHTSR